MGIGCHVCPIARLRHDRCHDDLEEELDMKSQIVLVFIVLFLISGCIATPGDSQLATATPNMMPRLNPSPTPSRSILPLTCQVTDLNVYINEADGYCFAYQSRFTLGDQPSDNPEVRGPAVDNSSEPIQATFRVEVSPSAPDKALRQQAEDYLREFSVIDPATFSWSEIQVDGETAWRVEPIPVMLSYRIVFVQHNGSMFRLMYWPVDIPEAQSDLNDLAQTTLGSFAFTK
jgi:hypothetical protein